MKYIILSIVIFCIGLYIYYINKEEINTKELVITNLFNGVSLFFIALFIYFTLMYGYKKGFYHTILTWCILVIATPIPEAGLIVSVPLKHILNINLDYTQMMVSVLSLIYIIYSYIYLKKYMNETKDGRFIVTLLELFEIKIFIISIFTSISISYLINNIIDYILFDHKTIFESNNIIIIIITLSMIMYYFHILKHIHLL